MAWATKKIANAIADQRRSALGRAARGDKGERQKALEAPERQRRRAALAKRELRERCETLLREAKAIREREKAQAVTILVEWGIRTGRLLPAMREWAAMIGHEDRGVLEAFLKDAPSIPHDCNSTEPIPAAA